MATGDWTKAKVCDLVVHARQSWPGWSWKLLVRPETLPLLDPKPASLSHPDPGYAPLEILTYDDCELSALDLAWDIVLASPVDADGFTPNEAVPSYWLDLASGVVDEWTDESHARLVRGS